MASLCSSPTSSSDLRPDYAEIILIRHGETSWNAEDKFQGHSDIPLNDVGEKQADAVAEKLSKEEKISAVYSSDLLRASKTAERIADKCGVQEVGMERDLKERNLGVLEGITRKEALETHLYAFQAKESGEEIPGDGESLDQLYKRCTSALQRIGMKHLGERVVVVTHGGVIRSLYKHADADGPCGNVLNASVNVIYLYKDKWIIHSWGDVSHLSPYNLSDEAVTHDSLSNNIDTVISSNDTIV